VQRFYSDYESIAQHMRIGYVYYIPRCSELYFLHRVRCIVVHCTSLHLSISITSLAFHVFLLHSIAFRFIFIKPKPLWSTPFPALHSTPIQCILLHRILLLCCTLPHYDVLCSTSLSRSAALCCGALSCVSLHFVALQLVCCTLMHFAAFCFALLRFAMLRLVTMCCATLRCHTLSTQNVELRRTMLRFSSLCCALLRWAALCCASKVALCCAALSNAMLRCTARHCTMLRCVVLCSATLYYVELR
jgi:hypothetical protein